MVLRYIYVKWFPWPVWFDHDHVESGCPTPNNRGTTLEWSLDDYDGCMLKERSRWLYGGKTTYSAEDEHHGRNITATGPDMNAPVKTNIRNVRHHEDCRTLGISPSGEALPNLILVSSLNTACCSIFGRLF